MFISTAAAPFLVAVPMSTPDGTSWMSDVHVYPKNDIMTIDKEVTSSPAIAVGDVVSYKITVSVPSDIATAKKFVISDVLDPALDVDASSVVVVANPGSATLINNTDYTVSYNSSTRRLDIAFTSAGFTKLGSYTSVNASFDTAVNNAILADPDLIIGNEAGISFTNKDGIEFEADTDGEGPKIHTASIEITKVDSAKAAVIGSEFKIASSEANAIAGIYLRIDPTTNVVYDSPSAEWTSLGAANDYMIAPANVASFKGLKDVVGTTYQSYWVVETKAPAGYNMLTDPIEVTFDESLIDNDYVFALEVVNNQGFVLPQTGGMGTIAFTVVGIVLLGLAAIIVLASKKKHKKDQAV
jgi:fimbrial isopeptide formation D2 family protein/LPXTG-motif cell wall-anchored protein